MHKLTALRNASKGSDFGIRLGDMLPEMSPKARFELARKLCAEGLLVNTAHGYYAITKLGQKTLPELEHSNNPIIILLKKKVELHRELNRHKYRIKSFTDLVEQHKAALDATQTEINKIDNELMQFAK